MSKGNGVQIWVSYNAGSSGKLLNEVEDLMDDNSGFALMRYEKRGDSSEGSSHHDDQKRYLVTVVFLGISGFCSSRSDSRTSPLRCLKDTGLPLWI